MTRHSDPEGPAYLHIYTTPLAEDAAPAHTIDVKTLHESEILDLLIEKTGAVVLQTPPEEAQEMAEQEEFAERSEKDRVEVREKLMKVRREEQLLKVARGELPNTA